MRRQAEAPTAARARPALRNFMPTLVIFLLVATVVIVELSTHQAWTLLLINPLINALVFLDIIVFGQFALAILAFTLILRLATLPFTVNQYRSMKKMQAIQPQIQDLQKKHKDPRRRQEEMSKLMREQGVNPLGCVIPTFLQFAVFIALFSALRSLVGGSPESLVSLSQHLYPIPLLRAQIPVDQHFLIWNLGRPDPTLIFPLLTAASTYVQQKSSMTPNATEQQRQQQQMMLWLLPMMLFFFTWQAPSGVALYWVASNVFSLFVSYYVYGRSFNWRQILSLNPEPAVTEESPRQRERKSRPEAAQPTQQSDSREQSELASPSPSSPPGTARRPYGKRRGKRKNRR